MAWTTIQFVFGLVHRYQVSIEGLDTCQIHVFLADLRSHMSGRVCYPIRRCVTCPPNHWARPSGLDEAKELINLELIDPHSRNEFTLMTVVVSSYATVLFSTR